MARPGGRRSPRTDRDRRRRHLGQNFLVDDEALTDFVDDLTIVPGQLVVEFGAGTGRLTTALARAGAQVLAVEADPVWFERAATAIDRAGLADRVDLIRADLRRLRLPRGPYRVAANPPFNLTTEILALLLDDPTRGPIRADLVLQRSVARKHATRPPTALRTAAWVPWWEFTLGPTIDRRSFRPRPRVDAQVLTIRRRDPPLLPTRLAPEFRHTLRPGWGDG